MWTIQEQEQEGTYKFGGTFMATEGVKNELSHDEILGIYYMVQILVKERGGLDYLQVFTKDDDDEKLFFVDCLNQEMKDSGNYKLEHNYCVLMLASEY